MKMVEGEGREKKDSEPKEQFWLLRWGATLNVCQELHTPLSSLHIPIDMTGLMLHVTVIILFIDISLFLSQIGDRKSSSEMIMTCHIRHAEHNW